MINCDPTIYRVGLLPAFIILFFGARLFYRWCGRFPPMALPLGVVVVVLTACWPTVLPVLGLFVIMGVVGAAIAYRAGGQEPTDNRES